MSIERCTECGSQVDTDYVEMLYVLDGKLIVCETCLDKDEIWETVDILQSALDRHKREIKTLKAEIKKLKG
jgi:hypothetical protein